MTDDLQVTDDPLKVRSRSPPAQQLWWCSLNGPSFRLLDWGWLAERRIVVGTRNLLDADVLRWVGFEVCGVGCSSVG